MGGHTVGTPKRCATRPNRRGLKAEPRCASAFAFGSALHVLSVHGTPPSPLVGEGWGEGAGACGSVATSCFALGSSWSPYDSGGRVEEKPAGWPAWMRASFSPGQEALSKNPGARPRTWRAESPEGASSGVPFLLALPPSRWLLFFGQAKKSDPACGSRSEARRRRARSP